MAIGGFLLWQAYVFLTVVGPQHLGRATVLLWFAITFWLAPYIVNIGWGVRWGMWPRLGLLALWVLAALVDLLIQGSPVGATLWFALKWSSLYLLGYLGLSFMLSALLATPGCEMRAMPHLAGLMSGKPRAEHYCPGFIDRIDRWERSGRSGGETER
jgi:hypothetical protein